MNTHRKKTIIVTDDDEALCDILKSMLTRLGYNVLIASNGGEAISQAGDAKLLIDAVILDLFLPDIRGDRLIPEIRRLQPDVKIILMSGYQLDNTEILKIKIDGFFQKPGSYTDLETVLRTAMI